MDRPLCFEEINLGDSWRSRSRTITESDVIQFACMTGDFDPLHVDHEFAKTTPFRQPIAHGLLGLSWVAGLGSQSPSVHTLAFVSVDDWRFLKPAYIGDTVHVVTECVEKGGSGRRSGQISWKRQLVNQDGDIVQSGFFRTLVACRVALRRSDESQDRKAG